MCCCFWNNRINSKIKSYIIIVLWSCYNNIPQIVLQNLSLSMVESNSNSIMYVWCSWNRNMENKEHKDINHKKLLGILKYQSYTTLLINLNIASRFTKQMSQSRWETPSGRFDPACDGNSLFVLKKNLRQKYSGD